MISLILLVTDYIPGSVSPRVSTTDDMVFAVNIPPDKKIRRRKRKLVFSQGL